MSAPYARFGLGEEPPENGRSQVEKDRDRIIHSSALRRLQGKTQIVGAQTGEFFRTRLTHSLECAQIGRAIARHSSKSDWSGVVHDFGDLEPLVEGACLAHDLGHPPFGHNGEYALQACMRERRGSLFEGNAQSFRIVSYLEPKEFREVREDYDRWVGLDLTRTMLQAITKYPEVETREMLDLEHPKFSVYDDPLDREYFDWLWDGSSAAPERTLATSIMDAADDIAYAAHDFEDGVWAGMIPIYDLMNAESDEAEPAIVKLAAKVRERHPSVTDAETATRVKRVLERAACDAELSAEQMRWARRPFERKRENVSYLKKLAAALIGRFILAVTPENQFAAPDEELTLELDTLTGIAWVWMIERSDLATQRYGQRRVITELFEGYLDDLTTLPRREELEELDPGDKVAPVRVVCDHIAGMTDTYAVLAHEEMYEARPKFQIGYTY